MNEEDVAGTGIADAQMHDDLQPLFGKNESHASDEAEQISSDAAEGDAALIERLRGGDTTAYTALWVKHVDAALRVARRLTPGHAEDLVSEGFMALYQQIAVKKNGPDSAFRAYLFTVMRNISARWYREGKLIEPAAEIDMVAEDDGLSRLEEKTDAEEMLIAFRALPERWQRVLWLVEVDEVPRPAIAQELGIKPNAVSVLYRRARTGLRLSWLEHQIPAWLREQPEHVAQQLPKLLISRRPGSLPRSVSAHLAACVSCSALYDDLQTMHKHMTSGTLAVAGFAALGVALPASSASMTALGVGGGALVIGGVGVGATLIAASVGLLLATGTLTTGLPTLEDHQETTSSPTAQGGTENPDQGKRTGQPETVSAPATAPHLGRGNLDPAITSIDFTRDSEPNGFYLPPPRPASPVTPLPQPDSDPAVPLRSGMSNPTSSQGYLAPVLSGTTTPGATIALELHLPAASNGSPARTEQFAIPVSASGAWSVDLRSVATDRPGAYDYLVWAVMGDTVGAADSGQFIVNPLGVTGFEGIPPYEMLPVSETSTSGIVIELKGPANGQVCVSSVYSGQTATVQLNSSGVSVQRLRLLSGGTYFFELRVCANEYRGPAFEQFIDVDDPDAPIFGPWGPDPADTVFELSEV